MASILGLNAVAAGDTLKEQMAAARRHGDPLFERFPELRAVFFRYQSTSPEYDRIGANLSLMQPLAVAGKLESLEADDGFAASLWRLQKATDRLACYASCEFGLKELAMSSFVLARGAFFHAPDGDILHGFAPALGSYPLNRIRPAYFEEPTAHEKLEAQPLFEEAFPEVAALIRGAWGGATFS